MVHSELPTTISSRRKKDPDVTPLPPLSPDLIWSFVSGKETSKFFDVDSIESADTTGRINAQWAHSSKIRSLCLMKLSSKTFQNFLPFSTLIGTRKPTELYSFLITFHFVQLYFFLNMNALSLWKVK